MSYYDESDYAMATLKEDAMNIEPPICATCKHRTINYMGYNYCPIRNMCIIDIWINMCDRYEYGNDGINPNK